MEKIYVIIGTNQNIVYVSSAVTNEKVAKALCEYKNACEDEGSKWNYHYEEVEIRWNMTDLQWLKDKTIELKMKELPY